ncbi:lipocalin family protein [Croceitalea marina]|uniref:Lipocalin family protein n=1 Tax=Croceitalea marina TaxID=1775166 RepID=A0ABW5N3B5_9FLAO
MMRKIKSTFIVLLLLAVSCSEDDSSSGITISQQNLLGKWFLFAVTTSNGTTIIDNFYIEENCPDTGEGSFIVFSDDGTYLDDSGGCPGDGGRTAVFNYSLAGDTILFTEGESANPETATIAELTANTLVLEFSSDYSEEYRR